MHDRMQAVAAMYAIYVRANTPHEHSRSDCAPERRERRPFGRATAAVAAGGRWTGRRAAAGPARRPFDGSDGRWARERSAERAANLLAIPSERWWDLCEQKDKRCT